MVQDWTKDLENPASPRRHQSPDCAVPNVAWTRDGPGSDLKNRLRRAEILQPHVSGAPLVCVASWPTPRSCGASPHHTETGGYWRSRQLLSHSRPGAAGGLRGPTGAH